MLKQFLDPYVLSALSGAICSVLLLSFLKKKRGFDVSSMFFCCFFAVVGMFIGCHILFFLVNLPSFSSRYGEGIYDIQSALVAIFNASSGMVFYGGLFGAVLAAYLFLRARNLPIRDYLNPLCCVMPLFHAFGRLGCTLGGCCYGIEYHGLFALQYTEAHINPGISDHIADFSRFPVQPLEAVLELLLCLFLVFLYIKKGSQLSLLPLYLLLYGLVRFLDEFLRGDEVRGIWGPFSTSQWIALASILGCLIYYLLQRKKADPTDGQTPAR